MRLSTGAMPLNATKKQALKKLRESAKARDLKLDEKTFEFNQVQSARIGICEASKA